MLTIRSIEDKKEWENFLDKTKPSTFLHCWSWGEFEKSFGRKVFRFGVYEAGRLVAVAQSVKTVAKRGTFLLCTHGPIIEAKTEEVFEEILKSILDEFKRIARGEGCDFVRVSTCIVETPARLAVFRKNGFHNAPIHTHSKLSWIIDLNRSEDELLQDMKKNARYGIRKALRDGIEVRTSERAEDIEIFWKMYEKTVKTHSFVPYSKDFIHKEFIEFAKSHSARWYFAYYEGEPVSAALVISTAWSAFYHHGASLHEHSSITPSELLQWQVIKDAKASGCRTYNLWGVVPDAEDQHPWAGFSRFKKSFGGRAENYIGAQDCRLSSKYWINYAIEKVRRWKRGV